MSSWNTNPVKNDPRCYLCFDPFPKYNLGLCLTKGGLKRMNVSCRTKTNLERIKCESRFRESLRTWADGLKSFCCVDEFMWSACSPSTPTIQVQIPLKCTIFIVQTLHEKNENKWKEAGRGCKFKNVFVKSESSPTDKLAPVLMHLLRKLSRNHLKFGSFYAAVSLVLVKTVKVLYLYYPASV